MGIAKWTALPVLDLARLEAGPAEKQAFLDELRETAHDLGFFYVSGHGIDGDLIRQVLALARRFFELPEDDKLAIEMINSPHFRGYNRKGMEYTRGQRDWREQLDIGAERLALPRDADLPPWARLQGPNQWPAALPELKPYASALDHVIVGGKAVRIEIGSGGASQISTGEISGLVREFRGR